MAKQRPGSGGLDKRAATEGSQERTEIKGQREEICLVGGGRDADRLASSVSSAKSLGGSVVKLETIPGELHLEILRLLDVQSLFAMRSVNRHFRQLMSDNEETIVRGCLQNIECMGPHAILLKFYPLTDPHNTTFAHAKRMYEMKRDTMRIARMVRQTQNAKIDALYCIRRTCERAQSIIFPTDEAMLHQYCIEVLRHDLLVDYTTSQIQHMLPLYIRLVFKTAELLQYEFRGCAFQFTFYFICNNYILARGPELLLQLENLSPFENVEELQEDLFQMIRPYFERFVVVHEELINELQTRGSGLMTDPGIEIQQFLQEEDTILDIRTAGVDALMGL